MLGELSSAILLTVALSAVAVSIVKYYFEWYQGSLKGLPPFAATPLPIVGNLLHSGLRKDTVNQFRLWRKQKGDIYSFYLGSVLCVVVNGYEAIHEALVDRSKTNLGRPLMAPRKAHNQNRGIAMASGSEWKERRILFLNFINSLDQGRNILEEYATLEITSLLQSLKEQNGRALNFLPMISRSFLSLNISFLFGRRFDLHGLTVNKLCSLYHTGRVLSFNVTMLNIFPILNYVPMDLFKLKTFNKVDSEFAKLFKKLIREMKENVGKNDWNCLVETYLNEKSKRTKNSEATCLDDEDLIFLLIELIFAGVDTVYNNTLWWVIYMCNNPKVQAKAYEEIKDVIGLERTPSLKDKPQLNYVNAMIQEFLRLANIVPFAFPHVTQESFELQGYTIPKDAYVLPCINSILHDESLWGGNVDELRPERFLDKEGNYTPVKTYIPFSVGRRICPGAKYANLVLYLYITFILQRFQILPCDAQSLPSSKGSFDGVLVNAETFQVRFVERCHSIKSEEL